MTAKRRRRVVAALALVGGAALVVKRTERRRAAIARVDADLRSPVLLVPFGVANERTLGLVRSLSARAVWKSPGPRRRPPMTTSPEITRHCSSPVW